MRVYVFTITFYDKKNGFWMYVDCGTQAIYSTKEKAISAATKEVEETIENQNGKSVNHEKAKNEFYSTTVETGLSMWHFQVIEHEVIS